ncbi:hypothetical protein ACFL3F_02345 [Planctomycetota bacterium]
MGTVKSRIHTAIANLRQNWKQPCINNGGIPAEHD